MYKWYRGADVCFVYLSDVSMFARSQWFTRGWNLQELIDQEYLILFDRDWHEIGTKLSLKEAISAATGVPVTILSGNKASIAERMSWASHRQTTRVEDEAYCLIGIFNINITMLYGEGNKAFIRLQEEIMKTSEDQTLFAWRTMRPIARISVLAQSPAYFVGPKNLVPCDVTSDTIPFDVTSRGIAARLDLCPDPDPSADASVGWAHRLCYLGLLACRDTQAPDQQIYIKLAKESESSTVYSRRDSHILGQINGEDFEVLLRRRMKRETLFNQATRVWET